MRKIQECSLYFEIGFTHSPAGEFFRKFSTDCSRRCPCKFEYFPGIRAPTVPERRNDADDAPDGGTKHHFRYRTEGRRCPGRTDGRNYPGVPKAEGSYWSFRYGDT